MGVGPLWAALAGWAFTFINTQVQEQRKAQIERVNQQLSDLYGPLLACVTATKSAYTAMVKQHSPDGTREGMQAAIQGNPDGPEARAFRLWMQSVLQPLNEKAAEIVQGGFALLEGSHSQLEADMLQLVAHVSSSRVILERWAQGDLSTTSAISYPDRLEQSVRREFARVKARQAALLGVRSPFHWVSGAAGSGHHDLPPMPLPPSPGKSSTGSNTHASPAGKPSAATGSGAGGMPGLPAAAGASAVTRSSCSAELPESGGAAGMAKGECCWPKEEQGSMEAAPPSLRQTCHQAHSGALHVGSPEALAGRVLASEAFGRQRGSIRLALRSRL